MLIAEKAHTTLDNSNHRQVSTKYQFYGTPSKKQQDQTAQKTLKKSVMERISSAKNYKLDMQPRQLIIKQQAHRQQKIVATEDSNALKQLILDCQSPNNPGFYQYVHWLKLHAKCFAYVDKKYSQSFWKILRLINYGQVLIPTGLLYELLCDIKKGSTIGTFQSILNKFLAQNQTCDTVKGFRDLNNYIPISEIQKVYKGKQSEDKKILKQKNSSHYRSQGDDVFNRVYSEAKIRRCRRTSDLCNAIVEETKKCYSKPKITPYKSESFKSLVMPERICHNAEKHKWKSEQQKFMENCQSTDAQKLFKAKLLDKTIFEGDLNQIPGMSSHLSRLHSSQAQKLKLKRYAQRPQIKKNIY